MLLVGLVIAIVALHRRRPPVTAATVTALAPWMAAGGTLYAVYQAGVVPEIVAPLFGSPAVYVTVGIGAGLAWAAVADRQGTTWTPTSAPGLLGGLGALVLLVALALAARGAIGSTGGAPAVSGGIAVASIVASAIAWLALARVRDVSATGTIGILAVFGHALDGISTAVGHDLLGFGEQTPLSRIILNIGESLPAPEVLGTGWLFVVVKLAIAVGVVVLFEGHVREDPVEGYLLLGLIVAVGLGPGFHNLVLFAIL
jgi:uncharacterized membrane protein